MAKFKIGSIVKSRHVITKGEVGRIIGREDGCWVIEGFSGGSLSDSGFGHSYAQGNLELLPEPEATATINPKALLRQINQLLNIIKPN